MWPKYSSAVPWRLWTTFASAVPLVIVCSLHHVQAWPIVFIIFTDVFWLLNLSILLSVLCSTVRHFQLINSCHKFSLDGVSTMKDAFLVNDLYLNFFHFIGEYFGKDIPKYSNTNIGSPGTQAQSSSLLLPVLVIFSCFIIPTHKGFNHHKKLTYKLHQHFSRPQIQQIYHYFFLSLIHV